MNIQLNYYKSKKINPVEIALEGTKWDIHFLHRKNLIEQHLKLPSSWFEGKKNYSNLVLIRVSTL